MSEGILLSLIVVISLIGLAFSYYLSRWVLSKDTGSERMQSISNAIKEGAEAFLRRQRRSERSLGKLLNQRDRGALVDTPPIRPQHPRIGGVA